MSVILWEWVGEGSLQKAIEVVPVLGGGAFTYDNEFDAIERMSFEARGLSWAELQALKPLVLAPGKYSLTDKHAIVFEGYVETLGWGWRELDGTAVLVARLEMIFPPEEPE